MNKIKIDVQSAIVNSEWEKNIEPQDVAIFIMEVVSKNGLTMKRNAQSAKRKQDHDLKIKLYTLVRVID